MSTDSSIKGQIPATILFLSYVKGRDLTAEEYADIRQGFYRTDRLCELFFAKRNETEVESVEGHDLATGEEVKYRTMQEYFNKRTGKVTFKAELGERELSAKDGPIIFAIANWVNGTLDVFHLPEEVYGSKKVLCLSWNKKGDHWNDNHRYLQERIPLPSDVTVGELAQDSVQTLENMLL